MNVVPEAAPAPPLSKVTELVTDPAVVADVADVAVPAVVAEVADVADVAVAALPEMLIAQVPEAPVPSVFGTAKLVRASAAVVAPVPPFATTSVPPKVRVPAPVIGPPLNVKPVVPPAASTEVTEPPPAVELRVPELNDKPDPTVTLLKPPALLPYKIDVPEVAGAKSVPDTAVVNPEPLPLRTPLSAVVTAIVPEAVTGEDPTVNPDGILKPTEVTVPPEPVAVNTPLVKFKPVLTDTLLKPPAPFPYRIDVPEVAGA